MRSKTLSLMMALVALGVLLASCSQQRITSYDTGVAQLAAIQNKYGVDFQQSPPGADSIASLSAETVALKRKVVENDDMKPLLLLFDYRINTLDADRLLIEGFQWGAASTTEPGFGCKKGSERILNSSRLRNESANAGLAAAESLRQFVNGYPEKAAALNLTQRTILSLTTTYAVVQKQAEKDHRIIMGFCVEHAAEVVVDGETITNRPGEDGQAGQQSS
ncbi:TPA: hypothetical protein HA281_00025 [Candidatus Woesearchaeota archaeon]|nr:hypothetical protein [Candidatus Woesearchaeota archaeon]